MLEGILKLAKMLKDAGCRALYLNGSFICQKRFPGDYDACWDATGVDTEKINPILLDFSDNGLACSRKEFGGDIRPDLATLTESIMPYLTFFQTDKRGHRKGIVKIRLQEDDLE